MPSRYETIAKYKHSARSNDYELPMIKTNNQHKPITKYPKPTIATTTRQPPPTANGTS